MHVCLLNNAASFLFVQFHESHFVIELEVISNRSNPWPTDGEISLHITLWCIQNVEKCTSKNAKKGKRAKLCMFLLTNQKLIFAHTQPINCYLSNIISRKKLWVHETRTYFHSVSAWCSLFSNWLPLLAYRLGLNEFL